MVMTKEEKREMKELREMHAQICNKCGTIYTYNEDDEEYANEHGYEWPPIMDWDCWVCYPDKDYEYQGEVPPDTIYHLLTHNQLTFDETLVRKKSWSDKEFRESTGY